MLNSFLHSSKTKSLSFRIGCFFFAAIVSAHSVRGAEVRLGIIGTDTSHVVEFTRLLNDPSAPGHVAGARIVAAFEASSPDIPSSRDRAKGFSTTLREKWHISFVETIGQLCPMVDGILLESSDGRTHLSQFRQAAACGKPVFIDKPLASTLADARKIARLAQSKQVPWFSTSAMRFTSVQSLRSPNLTGAFVWGPGPLEPHHHLELSWYAIHPIEMLFTLMGTDVEQVTRTYTPGGDEITGIWKGGRIGTVRTIRPYGSYGAITFLPNRKTAMVTDISVSYVPLLQQIVKFMQTGIPPISNQETLRIYSFLDAAQRSRERGGTPVRIPQR
jgi:hypothetical protein